MDAGLAGRAGHGTYGWQYARYQLCPQSGDQRPADEQWRATTYRTYVLGRRGSGVGRHRGHAAVVHVPALRRYACADGLFRTHSRLAWIPEITYRGRSVSTLWGKVGFPG